MKAWRFATAVPVLVALACGAFAAELPVPREALLPANLAAPRLKLPPDPAKLLPSDATRPSPAVSLDRRVPAAQPTDREGLSVVGLVGAAGELGRVAAGRGTPSSDTGLKRLVRTLRESVLAKRIAILSESGRIVENDPYLVGVSFTHK